MKLVIVESPSKCNSISKYLGKGYKVVASKGHIRELATSGEGGLGIDIKNDFEPTYKIIKAKKPLVDSLIKDAKAAEIRNHNIPGKITSLKTGPYLLP